jgi:hypothetical protein
MSVLYYLLLGEVTLTSSNNAIRISEASTAATASITAGTYFLRGDATSDDLCAAIKTALEGAQGGGHTNTYTVSVAFSIADGAPTAVVTVTRATGSETFALLFSNGSTTFDEALIGFANSDTAEDASAKASTLTPTPVWAANNPPARDDPVYEARGAQVRMTDGGLVTFDRGGPYSLRSLRFEHITAERTHATSIASDTARAFKTWWARHRDGKRFELHGLTVSGNTLQAPTSSTLIATVVLDEAACSGFAPVRTLPGLETYAWDLGVRSYVA